MTAGGRRIRPPAIAGTFYPAQPEVLRATIEREIAAARAHGDGPVPKALVGPHAGYAYSGPVAASAWARVVPLRGLVERVVLLGPAHRSPWAGIAASGADAFTTPLGELPVDAAMRDECERLGLVVVDDAAHRSEHSVEAHLPFVQVVLGDVLILPLVVGNVPAGDVEAVLERVWGSSETLVVVSTDLSHYLDHRTAQELDRRTAAAIVARRPGALEVHNACGVFPLRGLLTVAARRKLDVELIDLRTSADTAGDPDRVVGYGAFVLT